MLGSIISGGLSLLGGLSARNAAKKTQKLNIRSAQFKLKHDMAEVAAARRKNEAIAKKLAKQKETVKERSVGGTSQTVSEAGFSQNSVDVAGMVSAAEAAGFNPVSFLRNGGLQAYLRNDYGRTLRQDDFTDMSVTTTRKGHNAVAAAQLQYRQPHFMDEPNITHVPGVGEAFANAGKAAFNVYNDDRIRAETQDFQRDLLLTQLAAIPGGADGSRSFYIPGFSTSGSLTRSGQGGALSGNPTVWEPGEVSVTNPYDNRVVDASSSDAAAWEERYGEVIGEVAGLGNLVLDGWANVAPTAKQWWNNIGSFFGGLAPASSSRSSGVTGSW